jgi:hypothetical protein
MVHVSAKGKRGVGGSGRTSTRSRMLWQHYRMLWQHWEDRHRGAGALLPAEEIRHPHPVRCAPASSIRRPAFLGEGGPRIATVLSAFSLDWLTSGSCAFAPYGDFVVTGYSEIVPSAQIVDGPMITVEWPTESTRPPPPVVPRGAVCALSVRGIALLPSIVLRREVSYQEHNREIDSSDTRWG